MTEQSKLATNQTPCCCSFSLFHPYTTTSLIEQSKRRRSQPTEKKQGRREVRRWRLQQQWERTWGSRRRSSGKRGFVETIDLKLKLEPATPAAVVKAEEDKQDDGAAVAAAKEAVAAAEEAGGKMKRSPSQSSVVTAAAAVQADPAEKPRAPKYVAEHLSFPPCLSLPLQLRSLI